MWPNRELFFRHIICTWDRRIELYLLREIEIPQFDLTIMQR